MPRRPTLPEQLQTIVGELDVLVAEACAGPLPPHTYDRLESDAQRIAAALVAAFRGTR